MPCATVLPRRDAKHLLLGAMEHHGFGYQELADALAQQGIRITAKSLSNKLNRGLFSADFLLECLRAMRVHVLAIPPVSRVRRSR